MASTADRVARRQPWQAGRTRLLALVAVLGPGLLAGLSDDDPAGITTYSVLGAQYGYELLWVLLLSTVALIVFHDLGARTGVVTGQGLIGLIRQRYGVRAGGLALVVLVLANIGTTCAEFAGIAAGFELFGVARYLSVPIAAVVVSVVVLRGSFHRVEHILIGLATVFVAYVAAGFLGGPDWAQALHGLVVPAMPLTRDAVLIATATASVAAEPVRMSCLPVDWSMPPKIRTWNRAPRRRMPSGRLVCASAWSWLGRHPRDSKRVTRSSSHPLWLVRGGTPRGNRTPNPLVVRHVIGSGP